MEVLVSAKRVSVAAVPNFIEATVVQGNSYIINVIKPLFPLYWISELKLLKLTKLKILTTSICL